MAKCFTDKFKKKKKSFSEFLCIQIRLICVSNCNGSKRALKEDQKNMDGKK